MVTSNELLLLTNNELVLERFDSIYRVEYASCSFLDVLYAVRDKLHKKYKLLTHPMAGSLKPNQTPYKSVLLMPSKEMDEKSIMLIENAIESAQKFLKFRKLPDWPESIQKDFKTLDLSYINGAVANKIEFYL